MQGATLQHEASARAADGTASQAPMAAHQNADKIMGLAAYRFSSGSAQIQDIYFLRQLTGEEMQKRMKDSVTPGLPLNLYRPYMKPPKSLGCEGDTGSCLCLSGHADMLGLPSTCSLVCWCSYVLTGPKHAGVLVECADVSGGCVNVSGHLLDQPHADPSGLPGRKT